MSKKLSVRLRDLDKDPATEEALYLADYMYEEAGNPEFSDDERWRLARELKDVSIFLVSETAQAVGSDGLSGNEFIWGNVRKQLSRLRAIYRFAGKRGFLRIDPTIMVRIDKFAKLVEQEVQASSELSDENARKDLKIWIEKHKIWKDMGHES